MTTSTTIKTTTKTEQEKRETTSPLWSGRSAEGLKKLEEYRKKCDKKIRNDKGRLSVLYGINDDESIVDLLSCKGFKKWQLKKKASFVLERDFNNARIDVLGDFLTALDRKNREYPIVSNHGLHYIGRKRDEKGKQFRFERLVSFDKTVFDRDGNPILLGDLIKEMADDSKLSYLEEMISENHQPIIDYQLKKKIGFNNPKHVLMLIKMYDSLKEQLVEFGDNESVLWELFKNLDILIEKSKFNKIYLDIIEMMKIPKMKYVKIREFINKKHKKNWSYAIFERTINLKIPRKIVETYMKNTKKR